MKVKTKGKQTNTASGVSRKGGVGRFNRLCESFFELEKQHSNDTVAYIATRDAVMFSPIAISCFYHQLVRRALSSQDKSFAGVSFESKVEFLKGYRFIFIGGDKALSLRLKELGFKNFKQLCSCTEIKQLKSYDYVVVCTKFVSHKLLYKAQSEINWGGNLIYFNGSGSKALVEQIYNELN